VKEWLKSVLNYRSYLKNKTGYPFFGPPCKCSSSWHMGLWRVGNMNLAVYCAFPQVWRVWRQTTFKPLPLYVTRRHNNVNPYTPLSVTSLMDDPLMVLRIWRWEEFSRCDKFSTTPANYATFYASTAAAAVHVTHQLSANQRRASVISLALVATPRHACWPENSSAMHGELQRLTVYRLGVHVNYCSRVD